jgi:hypothetical protein
MYGGHTVVGSDAFGTITAAGDPRVLQLALKFCLTPDRLIWGYAAALRRSICRSQPVTRFQLVKIWSTKSSFPASLGRR